MSKRVSRRTFLGTAAKVSLGLTAANVRAVATRPGPNESLRVGLIGCGSRGPYLGYVAQLVPGVKLAAVCDVHAGRMGKAVQQAEGVSGEKPRTYGDYRKLLEDQSIDAVMVATSIHWHALPAIDACAAGMDVYLEKPVSTSIGEGRAVIEAARRHGRIVQMGTQQHSWEHYTQAVEIIRSGALGSVSSVRVWDVWNQYPGLGAPPDGPPPAELDWEFYLGPSPKVPYNPNRYQHHDWFFGSGGGWTLAWGVHHYDIVHWAMGVKAPATATGAGGKFAFPGDNREWPDTFEGTCAYPPGPVAKNGFLLTYTCRTGCDERIMGSHHGKAFFGTDGTLVLDRHGFRVLAQIHEDKKATTEHEVTSATSEHDVVRKHVASFFECVRSRRQPEADIEVGHLASNPGHLMNIAWRVGRTIRWDAQTERVIDDAQANALVAKQYRPPWALPG